MCLFSTFHSPWPRFIFRLSNIERIVSCRLCQGVSGNLDLLVYGDGAGAWMLRKIMFSVSRRRKRRNVTRVASQYRFLVRLCCLIGGHLRHSIGCATGPFRYRTICAAGLRRHRSRSYLLPTSYISRSELSELEPDQQDLSPWYVGLVP